MRGTDHRESGATSDEALVAAAVAGDESAFEVLLGRHERRVLRVLRLLAVPPQDREDLAQETFIRVFRHLRGFKPGHPFAGWLYRITVNVVHDHRGRAARRSSRETTWADGLEGSPDPRPGPEEHVEERDWRRRLESALGGLSERERAVFVLREMERLETREVARILGVTSITVRRHLGLARKRLQKILSGDEKNPLGVERPALDPGSTRR